MIRWWSESSGWIKYGFPVVLLAVSTIAWLAGCFWPWGWAVGAALLVASVAFSDVKSGWENHDGGASEEQSRIAFEEAVVVDDSQEVNLCESCDRFNGSFSLCTKFEIEPGGNVSACNEYRQG